MVKIRGHQLWGLWYPFLNPKVSVKHVLKKKKKPIKLFNDSTNCN